MSFQMNNALEICLASVKQRKQVQRTSYTLYYSHNLHRYDGKMVGSTIKGLQQEFMREGGNYRYAVITPTSQPEKYLRVFDRSLRNKFFSLTRGKKANA